jgi:hypothetical protein
MAKTLNTNVSHGGVWYRAGDRVGDQIPDEVAEKITNPKVWAYSDDEQPEPEEAKSTTGAQLVARVAVGGAWYGPGDDVPDDVARRITNPKVWEGGKAPFADEKKTAAANAPAEQSAPEPAAQAEAQTPPADTAEDTEDTDGDRRPASRRRRA